MRERVPMTDFARQWAEHVAASASPRMTDDQAERDFWHAFMTRKTYAPEPSALQVLERLRPLLRARGVETALEVGPGWGSYTMTLAELCREVACVRYLPGRTGLRPPGRGGARPGQYHRLPCQVGGVHAGAAVRYWSSAITASTGRRIWPTASGGWTGRRTSCAWRA